MKRLSSLLVQVFATLLTCSAAYACAGSTTDSTNTVESGSSSGAEGGATSAEGGATSATGGTSGSKSGTSSNGGSASSTTASSTTATALTWSQLYSKYLASGTIGHCASCHSDTSSASAAYAFLKGAGQINGTGSRLTVQGSSRLIWFGGSMPQDGKASDASAQVLDDFRAWVAAGAQNN